MTKEEIIQLIKDRITLYENHAKHERKWIDGRTNPTEREVYESEHFIKTMMERGYGLSRLLEEIEDIEAGGKIRWLHEGKEELTPQQEERQEWLEETAQTVQEQADSLGDIISELEYID